MPEAHLLFFQSPQSTPFLETVFPLDKPWYSSSLLQEKYVPALLFQPFLMNKHIEITLAHGLEGWQQMLGHILVSQNEEIVPTRCIPLLMCCQGQQWWWGPHWLSLRLFLDDQPSGTSTLSWGGRPCPMAAWTVLHPLLLHITSPVFWEGDGNISSPDSIENVLLTLLILVPLWFLWLRLLLHWEPQVELYLDGGRFLLSRCLLPAWQYALLWSLWSV